MSSKALKGGNKRESNMKLSGSTREVAVKGLEGRGDGMGRERPRE